MSQWRPCAKYATGGPVVDGDVANVRTDFINIRNVFGRRRRVRPERNDGAVIITDAETILSFEHIKTIFFTAREYINIYYYYEHGT